MLNQYKNYDLGQEGQDDDRDVANLVRQQEAALRAQQRELGISSDTAIRQADAARQPQSMAFKVRSDATARCARRLACGRRRHGLAIRGRRTRGQLFHSLTPPIPVHVC